VSIPFHVLPFAFVLLVWWLSTGLVIYVDGLPRNTFRWSMAGASVLALIALAGLALLRDDTSIAGAYAAFTCGVLVWAWPEVGFYTGYFTGARRAPCPPGCGGLRHFAHAVHANLHHELAILATSAVVIAMTWNAANPAGLRAFLVLWGMQQSAKLNVFLGVRNLNEELLPPQLQHLRGFLTRKSINLLFPFSVTAATVVTAGLFGNAFAEGATSFESVSYVLAAALMALGLLEHWLLVLPLSATRLWSWSMRSHKHADDAPHVEHGPDPSKRPAEVSIKV
jgi:putative photosynthetic complex assembly protein 2